MDAKFFNSLVEGDFGNGYVLCQSLLEGDFWSRRQGCYNVYRGSDRIENIDFGDIVTSTTSKGKLALPSHLSHDAATNYYYAVRCASGTGKEEQGSEAMVQLSLDESGSQRPERPNCVIGLCAVPVADGRIRLSWWYWPLRQEVVPDHFSVFSNGGAGAVDFDTEVAQISYTGEYFYSYLTASGGHEEVHQLAVRAVSAAGNDDGNLAAVVAQVNLSAPDSIEGLAGAACL